MSANQFLRSLSPDDQALLMPHLRKVGLRPTAVLVEQGTLVETVHFPIDAQVTNIVIHDDGSAIEISVVGAEGVTGLLPFIADAPSAWRTSVRLEGAAWALSAQTLRSLQSQSESLAQRLIQLGYFYQVQAAYNVVCTASHPIGARVARWILTAADLSGTREIRFTQEEMAALLSVQRTSVVEAFSLLKAADLIRHLRAKVTIEDRAGLTRQACSCYATLRAMADDMNIMPAHSAAMSV